MKIIRSFIDFNTVAGWASIVSFPLSLALFFFSTKYPLEIMIYSLLILELIAVAFFVHILTLNKKMHNLSTTINQCTELNKKVIDTIFADNLLMLSENISKSACKIIDYYNGYMKSLGLANGDKKFIESYESQFYNNLKSMSEDIFANFVETIKSTIVEVLKIYEKETDIGVSIKLLKRPFMKPSNESIDDLEFFTIIRDKSSLKNGREANSSSCFKVAKHSGFSQCIKAKSLFQSIYINNDIRCSIENNQMEVVSDSYQKFYNSVAIVPVYSITNTYRMYYGFITIDSLNKSGIEIFKAQEIQHVLFTYAHLLCTYFSNLDVYSLEVEKIFSNKLNLEGRSSLERPNE